MDYLAILNSTSGKLGNACQPTSTPVPGTHLIGTHQTYGQTRIVEDIQELLDRVMALFF